MIEATLGWARGNCSAAAASGVSWRRLLIEPVRFVRREFPELIPRIACRQLFGSGGQVKVIFGGLRAHLSGF